jgi:hypothetical protein
VVLLSKAELSAFSWKSRHGIQIVEASQALGGGAAAAFNKFISLDGCEI